MNQLNFANFNNTMNNNNTFAYQSQAYSYNLPQYNISAFTPTTFNTHLTSQQAQLILMQQQIHQKGYINSLQCQSSPDAGLLANPVAQHYSNQNAHGLKSNATTKQSYSSSSSSTSSSSTSSPINSASSFSSSFSVNSLLSNGNSHIPASSSSPLSLTPDKMSHLSSQAAAALSQHIATAMANYRLFQQQQQRHPLYPLNDPSAEQLYTHKRAKGADGLNTSQCSMSSASSSSSAEYSNQQLTNKPSCNEFAEVQSKCLDSSKVYF